MLNTKVIDVTVKQALKLCAGVWVLRTVNRAINLQYSDRLQKWVDRKHEELGIK